jgi:peptide/nickel transport system substrate-binding protein
MHPIIRLVAVVFPALALISGIGRTAWAGKADDTLNVAFDADFQSIDPYYGATREGNIIVHHVYDALLYRDPVTFEVKPSLATSYRWIDDTTIEFKLRQAVKFHNGDAFDADDVVFTFNHVVSSSGVLLRSLIYWIKSAEKIDQYTVQIHLVQPFAAALDFFALPLRIYPGQYFQQVGPKGMERAPVGTGPYKVVELVPGRSVTLERFDGYFADGPKGRPAIKRINIRIMPEMNTQIAELITGTLDWVWRVPPELAAKLERMGNLTTVSAEAMRFSFLSFDAAGRTGASPLQDVRVRRAIAHAINRQAIRDNLVQGPSRVIDAACFPSQFGCVQDVDKYAYDPAKAKQLLAEAGYAEGFEVAALSYGGTIRRETEAVVGDLRAIGIKVTPQFLQPTVVRQRMSDGQARLVHMHWGSDSVNDVIRSAGQFFDESPYDMARDDEVTGLLRKGGSVADPERRKIFYKEALQKIAHEAYWIPITTFVTNYAFTRDLDFTPSVDEYPRFYRTTWK